MHVAGTATLTYRSFRRMAIAQRRTRWWVGRSFAILLAVCGAAWWPGLDMKPRWMLILAVCLLLLSGELRVALEWLVTRDLAKAGPFHYEITGQGVTLRTARTEASVHWEGISAVRTRRSAWFFLVGATGRPLAVPRTAFSAVDQEQIDTYLRGRPATTSVRSS